MACSPQSRHTCVMRRGPGSAARSRPSGPLVRPVFWNVSTKLASAARSSPVARWIAHSASVNAPCSGLVRASFIHEKPAGTNACAVSVMPRLRNSSSSPTRSKRCWCSRRFLNFISAYLAK